MVGRTLAHYEILEPLGAGGMGAVYRARDTTLKRDVAIKVLPEDLSADPDRLARLEREAHLLAALNHANIATIHSLEEADGIRFLVLELVKGDSLEERLSRGPMPIEAALELCKQIAEALEAAHGEGIIHRDLKPANVLITPKGKAKVLDFGLAKTVEATPREADMSHSPTLTVAGTQAGVILGTAPYMSPEQARGEPLDKRTDIWAFGCVLYEALVGRRAFDRETVADTLAAIIEADPNWEAIPAATPPLVHALIKRCLRKDPDRRLHDIADARVELEEPDLAVPPGSALGSAGPSVVLGPRRIRLSLAATAVVVVATAASLLVWNAARPLVSDSGLLQEYVIRTSPGTVIRPVLSPDGRHLVYGVAGANGVAIYHRVIGQRGATLIPGVPDSGVTQDGFFFSPDSQSLGYSTVTGLWRIPISGGTPVMIHDAPAQATWADDEIIFVQDFSLYRVSENGGQRDLVAGLDPSKGIARYGHPHSLPGGKAVLVEIWGDTGDRATEGIWVVPLDTGQPTIVAEQGQSPTYATTGHTVYARQDGTLEAVPFDPERLEKLGPAVRVRQGVFVPGDHAAYTLSEGQLVYVPAPATSRRRTQMVWVDRQGNETMIANEQQLARRDTNSAGLPFDAVRLSPDGTRIAAGSGGLVWLLGIGDGTLNPLGEGGAPLWTRGGEKVLSTSQGAIYQTDSDFSSSEPELLLRTGGSVFPISLSKDGKQLLLHEQIAITQQRRIGMMSIDGDREVTYPLDVRGELNQRTPTFSPEDNWVAYVSPSPQTGRSEVWVVSFPDWDSRHPVSNAGGYSPMWGRDETELFYIEDQRMILAHLKTGPDFGVLDRDVLFQVTYFEKGVGYRTLHDYDPVTDRFLMVKNMDIEEVLLTVVVNWFEELKERVPTGR